MVCCTLSEALCIGSLKQLFGTFNAVGFIFAIFLPETKGLSLEEMDVLFGLVDESTRRLDIEEHLGVKTETTIMDAEKGLQEG